VSEIRTVERLTTNGRRDIQDRTFLFALNIVRFCKQFDGRPSITRTLVLQLLRSGTSVGANVEEAQAGQSRTDFISKYSISLKEIRETRYWLRLIAEAQLVNPSAMSPLIQEASELCNILGAIVSRTKQVQ
jgi:four helix bundle protein